MWAAAPGQQLSFSNKDSIISSVTDSSQLAPSACQLSLVDTLTEEALLVRHGAMDDGFADVSRAHSDRFGAYCR